MDRALVGENTESMKLGTPALTCPNDGGGVRGLHQVVHVGQKDEAVIRLVLILEYDRFVDADRNVCGFDFMVVNRDFSHLDKQLFFLVLEPTDDSEIENRLPVRSNGRQR